MAQQPLTKSAIDQSKNLDAMQNSLKTQLAAYEQKFDDFEINDSTIFVSIINYRDLEGQFTLQDLYSKAANPSRIFVGYLLQYDPVNDSPDINYHYNALRQKSVGSNIRTLFMPYTQARGPIFARHLVQKKLYKNEKYYLQIDCHMRFVQNWDQILIKQYLLCNDAKAIITTYPNPYDEPYLNELNNFKSISEWNGSKIINMSLLDDHSSVLCADKFENDSFLRIKSKKLTDYPSKPIKTYFIASGFYFGLSSIIRDCPQDPNLKCIFFGEESLNAVKLFTFGYNFYIPTRAICYHLWNRKDCLRKGVWRELFKIDKIKNELINLENKSKNNLLKLFNGDNTHNINPLGTVRTLQQYQTLSGVNFKSKSIVELAKFGGFDETQREKMLQEFQSNKIMDLISSFQTQ